MPFTRHLVWLHLGIVALILLAMVPTPAAHAAQAPANSYDSGLGYTITWSDEWVYDETFSIRSEGVLDLITLWNSNSDFLMISGVVGGNVTPASLLVPGEGDEVISSDLEAEVPRLVTESDGFRSIAEGYELVEAGVVISVSLTATVANYDTTLAQVQGDVKINASPVLSGQPLAEGDTPTDLTGAAEPTAEPTSGVTRTQRGGSETPAATEAPSTVTRTTRNANQTPTPTEATASTVTRTTRNANETPTPTAEAAQVVTGNLETFVGPVFGYAFNYDPALWEAGEPITSEDVDGISLSSPTSSLTVWAWKGYGNDPVACLEGEAAYYASEVESISAWEPVLDANGDPLRGEDPEFAWGVYSLTYQNDAGDQTPLIDYIGCQPIPGQDAVLIVLLSSVPETYNDNLDLTFDILDTVQFNAEAAQPQPTEATAPTTVAAEPTTAAAENRTEIDTSFDGSLYTSPTYGFTVYVPLEWTIVSETAEGAEERLVISNGTSELTLWATNAPVGDLSGCVDYAADNSGKNLSLLQNSTGGDFRGDNGEEAFGNFVYDANGVQMMYFIGCRPIPGTDGVLIVIQDVEFSQFTSERRFRTDIEESITMP